MESGGEFWEQSTVVGTSQQTSSVNTNGLVERPVSGLGPCIIPLYDRTLLCMK